MKKTFSFYIIDENGKMRCTEIHICTEEERAAKFKAFRYSLVLEYGGWIEGDLEREVRELKEKVEELTGEIVALEGMLD